MIHQRLIRRTLLATAISISAASAIQVFGVEQGQYQPGQPGQQIPQGNTSVTQELNRMFQESGQQMPSMNPQELPNANTPIQGQVRPRQSQNVVTQGTNQNLQNAQQASDADRPGPIMRFFGKLRGESKNSTTQNNQNYRPPVPPDYKNESPSTAAVPQTPRSNPEATQFTNGGMSRISSQSGATVQAVSPEKQNLPVTSVGEFRDTYTQPGSAPGFMSSAGSSTGITKTPPAQSVEIDRFQEEFIRENSVNSGQSRTPRETIKKKIAAATAAAEKEVSEFESPFLDSTDSVKSTELLDLDSLIEIPKATQEQTKVHIQKTISQAPAYAAPATPAPKPAAPAAVEPDENVSPQAEPTFQNPSFDDAESESLESQAENSVVAPGENPFTGVQLEAPNDVFLNEEVLKKGSEGNLFDAPAAPMEEFNTNLPAIDLAPVEDGDSAGLEEVQPTPGDSQAKPESAEIVQSPVDGAATAESQPRVNVPKALSSAETERLRQTAEQERRQRQHRQILSRAGQSGFKGFCPVTLRDRRELEEADPQFSSTFGLQTYTFSSAESKIAFDSDPSRYAPAAGGSDVVVLVNSGEEQAGQLDYALWYRDRLYLFRSRETMTLFSKDPQRFASQY